MKLYKILSSRKYRPFLIIASGIFIILASVLITFASKNSTTQAHLTEQTGGYDGAQLGCSTYGNCPGDWCTCGGNGGCDNGCCPVDDGYTVNVCPDNRASCGIMPGDITMYTGTTKSNIQISMINSGHDVPSGQDAWDSNYGGGNLADKQYRLGYYLVDGAGTRITSEFFTSGISRIIYVNQGFFDYFYMTITAPSTPGTYYLRWQMNRNQYMGGGYFGSLCQTPVVVKTNTPPIGYSVYNTNNCQTVTGWTCDADYPSGPTKIDTWDTTNNPSNVYLGQTSTSYFWDAGSSIMCGGVSPKNYGYTFTLPQSVKDNTTHKLGFYALDTDYLGNYYSGGSNTLLTGRQDGVDTADKRISVLCSGPTINTATALQVKNAGTTNITGTWGISGKQTTESGLNWLNPMYIRQNATKGSGNLKLYITAFYDRKQGAGSDQAVLTSLSAIEGQIDTDASRGFILAYAAADCANQSTNCPVDNKGGSFAAGQYYAYVRGSGGNNWVNISGYASSGYPIYDNYGNLILRAYPYSNGSYYGQWKIQYYAAFSNSTRKGMYTAGYAVDSNNLSSFASNQNATLLP